MKYAIHLLLLGLLLVPAAAAEGELVTWSSLGTYAGAAMMTAVAGQFFSRVPALRRLGRPAAQLSYGAGVAVGRCCLWRRGADPAKRAALRLQCRRCGFGGGGHVLPPAPGQGRACHNRRTR